MKRIHLIFILLIISPFVYSQEYTLKDLKVNGKVKKISQYLYGSDEASEQIDTLYLINQTIQFFNEQGYLTLDSGVTFSGENFQKEVYFYNSLNRLTQIITHDKGFDDKEFRKSEVKEFRYDQNGNVIFESHSVNFGGTSIEKFVYNEENKIIHSESYYINTETDSKDTSPDYTIYEYNLNQRISKSYNSDSSLSAIWIREYENENCEKISKIYAYYKLKDTLELFEKWEIYYEDSTKIRKCMWRKNPSNLSLMHENIKYFDTKGRLIKQEYYENGAIANVDDYFYDENGNCIKKATHFIIPMIEHPEYLYRIYKYEFY